MQGILNVFNVAQCADTFKCSEASVFGVDLSLHCESVRGGCYGRKQEWSSLLKLAKGYNLPRTKTVAEIPELPSVIHSIKGDRSHIKYMDALDSPIWAIPSNTAIAEDLNDTNRLRCWLNDQQLPSERTIILHQESQDKKLESYFTKTYHPNFFQIMAATSNCVVIAPNYSVYSDGSMCRHHQLYNLKRSVDFFVRASDHGIRCIPSIGWSQEKDLERIVEWLNYHLTIRHISINCQTIRSRRFPEVLRAIQYIETNARPLKWIVFGGRTISRYLNQLGYGDRLHLITASHIQASLARRNFDKSFIPNNLKALLKNNTRMVERTFGSNLVR